MVRTEGRELRNENPRTKMNNNNADHDIRNRQDYGPQRSLAWLRFFLTFGLLSVASLMAGGKLSPDLDGLPQGAALDVIVQFTRPPSAANLMLIRQMGGSVKRTFPNIPGALITLPAAALNGIAANPNVKYISPDRKLGGRLEFAEPTTGANIALQYGWNGSGVGVAIVDSGIYASHPDLKPRVVYSESFVSGDATTDDAYGHGTHVAGIVGGNGNASTGPNYT